MTTRRLTLSDNKMIAGVCAGFAEYFGLDVNLVRIGYVVLSLISAAFPGILVYFVAWILMAKN